MYAYNLKVNFRLVIAHKPKAISKVMWDFEGIMRYSPIFYGYYNNFATKSGYPIPLAYFCAGMSVYVFR